MAHCSCYYGHDMWNGDGKPIVYAFRVGFLKEFIRKHPMFRLGFDHDGFLLDCIDEHPDEDLDCWYCDGCRSLAVFVDSRNIRYDFARTDIPLGVKETDVSSDWDRYIAMRDEEYERFMDSCEGMILTEAIKKFAFQYYCRVSPDQIYIYAFDGKGKFQFGFEQKRVLNFNE